MGLGFTLTLLVMSSIREIFGAGTWYGMEIPFLIDNHVSILTQAPGGFFIYGCLIALAAKLSKGKVRKEAGCAGCPSAGACSGSCQETAKEA